MIIQAVKSILPIAALLASTGCFSSPIKPPIFSSSVDPVFDIIRVDDPSAFVCMEYSGRDKRKIWDKRVNGEPYVDAFLFAARFSDGHTIEIAINPEFESINKALIEASFYTTALGQIPSSLRAGIQTFSVHKGSKGFHAGTGGMVFYSDKARLRVEQKHLEESIFHESVHTSWDEQYRNSDDWVNAQKADRSFLTDYGKKLPQREDLAESALLAYALIHHPGRIPPVDTNDILELAPSRIKYIETLLPRNKPLIDISPEDNDCKR